MRAIGYNKFGTAAQVLKTTQLPDPAPGQGDVVVKLAYSGVNPSDVKSRMGGRPGIGKPAFDFIVPHSDGSGVVTDVGAGVDPTRIGQRVWIWNGQWGRALGTMAEYIAVPSAQAVHLPDEISLEAGATFGIPGLTAAQCVLGGDDVKDKTVLISGGAGAVGHFAVQIAKWAGAQVIATASPKNWGHVQAAGADHVLDYNSAELSEQIRALCPNGVDRSVELEFGSNISLLAKIMRPLGTIAAYGSAIDLKPSIPFGPLLFKALKIDITLIYILDDAPRHNAIDSLHQAFADGALMPSIDEIYEFEACVQGHEKVEQAGRRGASLIKL